MVAAPLRRRVKLEKVIATTMQIVYQDGVDQTTAVEDLTLITMMIVARTLMPLVCVKHFLWSAEQIVHNALITLQ